MRNHLSVAQKRFLSCLAIPLVAAACHHGSGSSQPVPKDPAVVRVVTAQTKDMKETLRIEGAIAAPPGNDVWVGAPFAGILAKLSVAEGDRVTKDQVLGTMQQSVLSAQAASAEAAVQQAREAARQAKVAFDRVSSLIGTGGASQQAYDDAKAEYAKSQAALEQAQGGALAASATVGLATLYSPINGVVGQRMHNPGEMLDAGTGIVRIADLTTLELDGHADAGEIPELKAGTPVTVNMTDPAPPIAATFIGAASVADPGGATVFVRALIPNPPVGLRPGMPANGEAVLEVHTGVVVVPLEALVSSGKDTVVYVMAADAKDPAKLVAQRRVVTTDIRSGNDMEIVSGVKAGDTVAIGGMDGLEDGAPVTTVTDVAVQ